MNDAVKKIYIGLEIGKGKFKYKVNYISSDVIILTTEKEVARYIPTLLISELIDHLEKGDITLQNILERKVNDQHIIDFINSNFDKYIFGYDRNIHDLCKHCFESSNELSKISPSKSINELPKSEITLLEEKYLRDFAFAVFKYFFENKWDTIIDNSNSKKSTIGDLEYLLHEFDSFNGLIAEFSTIQNKENLTSSNTLRYFTDSFYNKDGKYYYFTTQWNGKGEYYLSFKNLKRYFEKEFPDYKLTLKDRKYRLLKSSSVEDVTFDFNNFFKTCIDAKLIFSKKLISRFVASLCTKPFVILSGLSGSGKTKIALSFAQWICQDDNQFCIVPVGADWTNREPLLGFPNALDSDDYVTPENGVLDLIIHANEFEELPHFLILDEMNLSHVERYFADFLSVMESNKSISLHSGLEDKNEIPSNISLPENLFIIGTVNIDETTYMFSPKVLDRANAIEFRVSEDNLTAFLENPQKPDTSKIEKQGIQMAKDFLTIAKDKSLTNSDIKETNSILIQFFNELKKTGAEFGYRSAGEIHRLISVLSKIDSSLSLNEKIDIAIMQKLLPKLHGSRRKLAPVLEALGSLCIESADVKKDYFENKGAIDFSSAKYQLSLEKITRMYRSLLDNGFASYAEA